MQIHSPKEIVDLNMTSAINKAHLPLPKMIALGILAGMFIAVGGVTCNTTVHSISNVGIARALGGAVFPIGLLMIVLVGGELFTGNCLMVMAALDKKIHISLFIRNLVIVFCSNLVGSLLMDVTIFFSGNLSLNGGALGAYTIKVALDKISISPVRGIASGMLCNFLVCMAILKGAAAKEVAGKIMATWFPIFAFVLNGFEHIVANMYYIPIGIMAKTNADYASKAYKLYGITGEQLESLTPLSTLRNFIPVTIGNILGGLFIGFMLYLINVRWEKELRTN